MKRIVPVVGKMYAPLMDGGFSFWYPFITYTRKGWLFSNGGLHEDFNINGWMKFEEVNATHLENE